MSATNLTAIKRFLKHFSPGTQTVKNAVLYSNGKTHMRTDILGNVVYNNERGSDAYFVVNPGGTKEGDINKLVACFVDLDAGRDDKGYYFNAGVVNSRKLKMRTAIKLFPLAPTFVVETRNGYQVYWLLKNTTKNAVRLNRWNTVQATIHKFFATVGADKRVVKCNQIMRLPHTTWYKKWEHKPEFSVKLTDLGNSKKLYRLDDFGYAWRSSKLPKNIQFVKPGTSGPYSYKKPTVGRPAPEGHDLYPPAVYKKRLASLEKTIEERSVVTLGKTETGLQTVIDAVSFLRDINFFLFGKGSKYLAKQATKFANDLSREFGVS